MDKICTYPAMELHIIDCIKTDAYIMQHGKQAYLNHVCDQLEKVFEKGRRLERVEAKRQQIRRQKGDGSSAVATTFTQPKTHKTSPHPHPTTNNPPAIPINVQFQPSQQSQPSIAITTTPVDDGDGGTNHRSPIVESHYPKLTTEHSIQTCINYLTRLSPKTNRGSPLVSLERRCEVGVQTDLPSLPTANLGPAATSVTSTSTQTSASGHESHQSAVDNHKISSSIDCSTGIGSIAPLAIHTNTDAAPYLSPMQLITRVQDSECTDKGPDEQNHHHVPTANDGVLVDAATKGILETETTHTPSTLSSTSSNSTSNSTKGKSSTPTSSSLKLLNNNPEHTKLPVCTVYPFSPTTTGLETPPQAFPLSPKSPNIYLTEEIFWEVNVSAEMNMPLDNRSTLSHHDSDIFTFAGVTWRLIFESNDIDTRYHRYYINLLSRNIRHGVYCTCEFRIHHQSKPAYFRSEPQPYLFLSGSIAPGAQQQPSLLPAPSNDNPQANKESKCESFNASATHGFDRFIGSNMAEYVENDMLTLSIVMTTVVTEQGKFDLKCANSAELLTIKTQ